MDFRFTIAIEELGRIDDAEANAEALLEGFMQTHPEAGAAVGANVKEGQLQATFCASGPSLDVAAKAAGKIFVEAAIASQLPPSPLAGFEVEADLNRLAERRSRLLPLRRRRRGADAWSLPPTLAGV